MLDTATPNAAARSSQRLAAALVHILPMASCIAFFTFAFCGFAYLGYLSNPTRTNVRKTIVENMVTLEQLTRAQRLPPADLGFIGDSSCLMGIHVPTLRASLPSLSIENFCTTARAGPASYAYMLDLMVARNSVPSTIVIAIHPIQFQRLPSWNDRVAFILANGIVERDDRTVFGKALDYMRIEWLSKVIYTPLPGVYGAYYGGETALFQELHANGGSLLDPRRELSADEGRQHLQPYVLNDEFTAALEPLARSIAQLPHRRVFLVLMPVPARTWGAEAAAARRHASETVVGALGLGLANILESDAARPNEQFAVPTHLGLRGRVLFTERLARLLRGAISASTLTSGDTRSLVTHSREAPHR
jgi:hypothetical protein